MVELVIQEIQEEKNLTFIHPFNDPDIIAGQGTVGLEIHEDQSDLDIVVVPIGGGGLISGVAIALKSLNPNIKIVAKVLINDLLTKPFIRILSSVIGICRR